jgi:hypothetical protein
VSDTTSAPQAGQIAFCSESPRDGAFQGSEGAENTPSFLIQVINAGGCATREVGALPSDDVDTTSLVSDEELRGPSDGGDIQERLEGFAKKVGRSSLMGKWILNQPNWKLFHPVARRVCSCGSYLIYRNYFRVKQWRLAGANTCCCSLLCPFCAALRGARHLGKALTKIQQAVKAQPDLVPYLWTATIKDEPKCGPMFRKLERLLQKVFQIRRDSRAGKRVPSVFCNLEGGIVSFECKRGKGSGLWHVHFHAIVLAPAGLHQHFFRGAWSQMVGYHAQTDLQPFRCQSRMLSDPGSAETEAALAQDAQEVFKYAVKFSDMTPEDNFEAFRELRGKRLIRGFGCLHKLQFADDDVLDSVDDLASEPYLELFFNLVPSSAGGRRYVNTKSQMVKPGEGPLVPSAAPGTDLAQDNFAPGDVAEMTLFRRSTVTTRCVNPFALPRAGGALLGGTRPGRV